MSSLHNHPVEDDIISAFKTTQNQSWSMFNDKLGGTPVHDSKKIDVFRSENPIELSDEDIPVFGLVPRLEKLMLVSCNKCSMVVKRDCIHHHYNRRHNNSEDDSFSLERFILPTIKTNKHRKQKITSIRKHSDKKIIDDEDIDPIVQRIKTEFNQFEFETDISQENVNQENEMQYDDESEVNLAIETCNTNTSCDVFDWNLPPFTQNLMNLGDHNENDNTAVSDEDCNKLSSDDGEQHSNTLLNVIDFENISYDTNFSELFTESLDSDRQINSNIVVDFSGIMSDDDVIMDEDPNDEYYHLPSRIVNHKEQTKLSTHNMDSDVMSNNNVLSDDVATTNYQSSTLPICVEEKTKLTSSESSESENDEYSNNVTTNIDQLTMVPVVDNEETQLIPCNKFSNVINNENSMNTIEEHQCKVNDLQNDNSGSSSNEEQTNCTPSRLEYFEKTSNRNLSSCTMNIHQTSTTLSNIKKDYQTLDEPPEIKEEYQPPHVLLDIKEEYQLPLIPLDIKEECQSPLIPQDITEEYQLPHVPLDIKEEYQPSQSLLSVKKEFSATSNTNCVGFLFRGINDSSEIVNWHLPSGPLNNEKQITGITNCEYLTATSSDSASNSITSDEQSYNASPEEYQLPIEPLHIKEKVQIISSPQYSNLGSDEKEKHKSNDVNKVTPPDADTFYSETKLLSSNTNVYAEFMKENYTDSVFANISSSLPPLNIQEEIIFSPRNNFTVNRNIESTDDCFTSDYLSTNKLQDIKELKPSLTTSYSNYSDSNVSINKYYQSAIGYSRNAALIPLSPSFKYLDTSDEEVCESAEEYNNGFYLVSPKLLNSYDDTSSTSSDEYSNDVNNIISDDNFASDDQLFALLSNRKNSKDRLMVDILDDTVDNKKIEDKYCPSSTESLDSEIHSPKCSNSMSSNSSNSSSLISYDELSFSLLGTDSKCTSKVESHSNSSFDESSDDSVSSSDQSTASSSDTIKKTKSTQTNICFNQKKHNKFATPSIRIDKSIAESLSVVNDLNKIAQTDESVFCEDCRRVSADLVEYYYPSNTRIEVDADIFFKDFYSGGSNAHITNNSVNCSNTKTTGHFVNSSMPVNSSAQTVNNATIPTGADQFELNNSDDYDKHINNCLLRLKQFSWDPNNPTKQNLVIENDNQLEEGDNISDFDLYADSQNDNVLYRNFMSGSTIFIDKNHAHCNERLKKNIDEKMAYAENCKYIPSLNANIGTKVKKSLKRRLEGQVADDKENREKNHRWITGSFKKLKRLEFVNRKFACSDESDNNVDE